MLNLSNLSLLLLIAHFLGDFHLQSSQLSEAKENDVNALIKHLLIHTVLLIVVMFLTNWQIYPQVLIVLVVHCLLDTGKYMINQSKLDLSKTWLYLGDQALHILTIFLIGQHPANANVPLSIAGLSADLLKWILLILLITKPANITFKIVFEPYQNYQGSEEKAATVPGAGAVIGNLERILSAIFLSMNSIGSIGLIYTAKSIARFKEIEQNQGFAEYYLIGTLYSILYVIGVYLLLI